MFGQKQQVAVEVEVEGPGFLRGEDGSCANGGSRSPIDLEGSVDGKRNIQANDGAIRR
jgi:hypothetical protein